VPVFFAVAGGMVLNVHDLLALGALEKPVQTERASTSLPLMKALPT